MTPLHPTPTVHTFLAIGGGLGPPQGHNVKMLTEAQGREATGTKEQDGESQGCVGQKGRRHLPSLDGSS